MVESALNVTELKERFVDVSEVMQADIKKLVQFQITNKCQSILKKICKKSRCKGCNWVYYYKK